MSVINLLISIVSEAHNMRFISIILFSCYYGLYFPC